MELQLSRINHFIGKLFKVGETIMAIADPSNVVVEIMTVKDAITVKKDAEINVFLDSDPLNVSLQRF